MSVNSIAPIYFAFIQNPAGKSNMMKLGVRLGFGLLEQSCWHLSWQQTVERNPVEICYGRRQILKIVVIDGCLLVLANP